MIDTMTMEQKFTNVSQKNSDAEKTDDATHDEEDGQKRGRISICC